MVPLPFAQVVEAVEVDGAAAVQEAQDSLDRAAIQEGDRDPLHLVEAVVSVGEADLAREGATRGSPVAHDVPIPDQPGQRDLPVGVAMMSKQSPLEQGQAKARARAGVASGEIR